MGVISRVSHKLNSLLTEDTSASDKPAGCHSEAAMSDDSLHLSPANFHRHLLTLLRGDALNRPLAGRVNFVELSKIREKLGARWAQIADRADEITRKAIERRLTSADMYTRYEELHYVIIFAQLGKEQAQLKCALIAEEIAKRLLGEEVDSSLLEVKTAVAQLAGDLKFENVPSIETMARRLAEQQADTAPSATDAAALHLARSGPDDEDAWWNNTRGSGADPLAGIEFVYRPMWDVKRNAVTTYLCVPALPGPAGRLFVGESELQGLDDDAIHRLDFLVQRRVISDLRKLIAANQRMLLCLPVHFDTLASNARRTEYIALCQRGIPPQGTKQLAFELTGVPAGVPTSRLLDLSAALRRYGRGLLMRTAVDQIQFRPSSECGVLGVGFENDAHGAPESRQIQDMERFAAAAKKTGLVAYVHGVPSISLTTAAIAAGFDFVDGDIVKSVVERPSSAYSFEMSDLFGRANDA